MNILNNTLFNYKCYYINCMGLIIKTKFLLILLISYLYSTISIKLNSSEIINEKFLSEQCKVALDFYIDRPDLETEFLRRFEYCKDTVKDVSPKGFQVNPILSDFKSMFGVNGRTRMQIHQGIDIVGSANEPILAIADGIVLETAIANCVGPSVVIDHGSSIDNKKLITIYSHTGEFLVKEGEKVARGSEIAKLPKKIEYPCMARVRHLHLQIGQQYCEKEEKNTWGCQFFIKDLYNSLNPHLFWANGPNNVTCFEKNKSYPKGTITYPFKCNKKIK